MIEKLKPRLVPKKEWGGEVWFEGSADLPLLVKYIFTTAKLSVQVHPDDAYARSQGSPRGKTEMWHVMSAQPGAKIAAGFREAISEQHLREAALSGEIMDLLAWCEACPGDTFFIPAGTVHAIGEGLVLCEIQQYSDITYRLYDYGRPRELHLDHALRVSHRGPCAARVTAREGVLVSCEQFTTERLRIEGGHPHIAGANELWIVLEGSGDIANQPMQVGEVWWTASNAGPSSVTGCATVLRTTKKTPAT
jgi:mannose-6-phosphate isomerase